MVRSSLILWIWGNFPSNLVGENDSQYSELWPVNMVTLGRGEIGDFPARIVGYFVSLSQKESHFAPLGYYRRKYIQVRLVKTSVQFDQESWWFFAPLVKKGKHTAETHTHYKQCWIRDCCTRATLGFLSQFGAFWHLTTAVHTRLQMSQDHRNVNM